MVVRTPPLSSLKKGFLAQIHQPLPLNKRESQQLLESITTSFRKNLDREHPWETDETPSKRPVGPRLAVADPPSTTNHRPTDRHLRAILSNPLFAQPRNTSIDTTSSTTTTSHNAHLDVFHSAVSKGLMNTRRAAGILASIRSQILAESQNHVSEKMGASGAGLCVLRWLRASGQESDLRFLSDHALLKLLVSFLYAEGLQEVTWSWLAQLASRSTELDLETTPGKAGPRTLSVLMYAIINENNESGRSSSMSLDGSYSALEQANSLLPRERSHAANAAVKYSWVRLSRASTVDVAERPKPSAPLFEKFLDIGRPLKLPLDLAHLDLHHPTTPTHSAAVEYLRLRQRIVEDMTSMKPGYQQRVTCLILDAAERLNRTGQADEAPWVDRLKNSIYERLNLGFLNLQIGDSLGSVTPIRKGLGTITSDDIISRRFGIA
ncbi:hypothetical protein NPX13_g10494 [Xylaria arbuscula]|uniref:Uncharacterized protein n=1 Tax=Xylaria arbuscula TaxID=114810 RepID=A0A9W8N4N1_9PEZI|nr:hypothetical protein NPX13_g10494 [Xylaria arbuscula]